MIAAITLRGRCRVEPGTEGTIGVPYEGETLRIADATVLPTSAGPLSSQNAAVAKVGV